MSRDEERRQHGRRQDRAEMFLGASRTTISNLSLDGAFVTILVGLQPGDSFSFELALDTADDPPVRGRAHVVWFDPGIGAGVRFDLEPEARARLASYLERIEEADSWVTPQPPPVAPPGEPPRQSRRTVAIGPKVPGEGSKVWFKYLPPDEPVE